MSHFVPQAFYYRLDWRARGVQPGSHPTRSAGGVAEFRGYVPFMQNPNPRAIDLRSTVRSMPRKLMVKSYYERSAIAVYAIVDLSTSMRFAGAVEKRVLAADIAASIAWSATRGGDSFSLIACDDVLHHELFEPPASCRGLAEEVRDKLLRFNAADKTRSANALPLAANQLRRKRSLVFMISDFHLEASLLNKTLAALAAHDVVPLVLWDSTEFTDLPAWGWARVRDMEGAGERSIFLRSKLSQQIHASYAQRRVNLTALCRKNGVRPPFFIQDRFNAEWLTRHLLEVH